MDARAIKQAILAGEPEGVRALHESHVRALYAFCYHRLGRDHHATEEVVQETMLLALDRIASFDPARGDLRTWLAFLSRNSIRRSNAERRRFGEVDPALDPLDGREDPPPDRGALVEVALARLPARQREVLEAKYVRGAPVRTIAAETGATEKAIESLLVRAREAFKEALTDLEGRPEHERC
jgi:RNA polymerase sigma-70 factor (ECF subfamily)